MFSILEIIGLEPFAGVSLIYGENTCDLEWMYYQTVLIYLFIYLFIDFIQRRFKNKNT